MDCIAVTTLADGLMMPALVRAICCDGVAELRRVVEGDRREDGDLPVGDVRRIPFAAHADLEHDDVDRRVGESTRTRAR